MLIVKVNCTDFIRMFLFESANYKLAYYYKYKQYQKDAIKLAHNSTIPMFVNIGNVRARNRVLYIQTQTRLISVS